MWKDETAVGTGLMSAAGEIPLSERPLVVQSDGTMLLEVGGPHAEPARNGLCSFAQLERSPEYIHTYRTTPLSLWNAASAGLGLNEILNTLSRFSRYPVPPLMERNIRDQFDRFGRVVMRPLDEDFLLLEVGDPRVRLELAASPELRGLVQGETDGGFRVPVRLRGAVKQALVRLSYPPEDLCGYAAGVPLDLSLRNESRSGASFGLRRYQQEAVDAFHHGGGPQGGAGVIVLPCGAGKTVIGMGVMARLRTSTLILCTNTVAVHQWRDEILDKTDLAPEHIGEYTGERKDVRPVTLATYQILTHRIGREGESPHLELMRKSQWGLIIYDEVHTLPAPVFRTTAGLQVRRRLGLTATLIREDGLEGDVFALIGPKKYELPWKILEQKGYIAEASCYEIRVDLPESLHVRYAMAGKREKHRIAAENPRKIGIVEELVQNNPDDAILVIGQYLDQLERVAGDLKFPLITGKTSNAERERLYNEFRQGRQRVLVVSKVANFAIDLPDASLAVEISGTFGSRQEEAQRLGRILRPKDRSSRFYSVVSRDTTEQDFGHRRQLFLVEQGYRYRIVDWDEKA